MYGNKPTGDHQANQDCSAEKKESSCVFDFLICQNKLE